jgi:hypothetical protein
LSGLQLHVQPANVRASLRLSARRE